MCWLCLPEQTGCRTPPDFQFLIFRRCFKRADVSLIISSLISSAGKIRDLSTKREGQCQKCCWQSSFSRTSRSITSLPSEELLSCSYAPKYTTPKPVSGDGSDFFSNKQPVERIKTMERKTIAKGGRMAALFLFPWKVTQTTEDDPDSVYRQQSIS